MTSPDVSLRWTPLGVRMGFTRRRAQRDQILAAIERMAWTVLPPRPAYLDGPAVRAIVNALYAHCPDQLRLVGIAPMPGRGRLIGLHDARGGRSYLLDLDTEVIFVLTQSSHPLTGHQFRVA